MHTATRTRPVTKLGVHTNEGPEGDNSASGLQGFLYRNGADGGGYNVNFDNQHTVLVQPDNIECYANGGVNSESLDGCFVGYAHQSAAEWDDAFSRGELEQAAQWYAGKCRQYGIPPVRLEPDQMHDHNARGIFGHIDVSNAGFANSAGHYDPGPNFPWAKFLDRIAAIIAPPIDWKGLAELCDWGVDVSKTPLVYGERGPNVALAIKLVAAKGFLPKAAEGDYFGDELQNGVHKLKQAHHWKPGTADGRKIGPGVVAVLLA